jgi:hypothetical protein
MRDGSIVKDAITMMNQSKDVRNVDVGYHIRSRIHLPGVRFINGILMIGNGRRNIMIS